MSALELEFSKSGSLTNEDESPNVQDSLQTNPTTLTSPDQSNSSVPNSQVQNNQIKMAEEVNTEDHLPPEEVINKQEDGYLVAVAGSLEGRSSRATDGDDSSLGNIGEEEEEEEDSEGDYIELPALTKPCSHDHPSSSASQPEKTEAAAPEPAKKFSKENVQAGKKGKGEKEAEEPTKARGRSNSLFKILGRRQKLVEEAEQKKDKEKLDEGEV